jgi:hypothetical protein
MLSTSANVTMINPIPIDAVVAPVQTKDDGHESKPAHVQAVTVVLHGEPLRTLKIEPYS